MFVVNAAGTTNGHLSIVVLRGSAKGAHSLNEVEVGSTLADVVDELLIDATVGDHYSWR